MLKTSKPICFVATQNPTAARAFYGNVLGLEPISDDPFAIAFDAAGIMLRVTKVREFTPAAFTVLGWQVDDIRAKAAELTEKGVAFEQYEGLPQDDLGVWESPDGALIAWFKDPDGNTLSLTQFTQ